MATKDAIETAYCFLHQKQKVYQYSTMDWQKGDIEYAIADFIEQIDSELYLLLSEGNKDFLRNHATFGEDMSCAVSKLEEFL